MHLWTRPSNNRLGSTSQTSSLKAKIVCLPLVQFSSVQSHLFLSLIKAQTLKMPVPYSPPSVGVYTRTPSQQPLVFGRRGTDHLP